MLRQALGSLPRSGALWYKFAQTGRQPVALNEVHHPRRYPTLAKLLLLVAVAAIVYVLLKNYRRAISRQQEQAPPDASRGGKDEDMVRCAQCGVHLPRSESFLSQGIHYCSEEHRKLGTPRRD